MKARLAVLALGLCLTSLARAQQPLVTQSLDSARVVRLRLASGDRVHAVLLTTFAPESAGVTFRPFYGGCGVPLAVCRIRTPVSDLRAIEVAHGNRTGRGAVIGAILGGMVGYALGATDRDVAYTFAPCPPPPGSCGQRSRPATALVAAAGAALGSGVGALFGLASTSWEPAP